MKTLLMYTGLLGLTVATVINMTGSMSTIQFWAYLIAIACLGPYWSLERRK